jgi:hypothetical protein
VSTLVVGELAALVILPAAILSLKVMGLLAFLVMRGLKELLWPATSLKAEIGTRA